MFEPWIWICFRAGLAVELGFTSWRFDAGFTLPNQPQSDQPVGRSEQVQWKECLSLSNIELVKSFSQFCFWWFGKENDRLEGSAQRAWPEHRGSSRRAALILLGYGVAGQTISQ